MEYHVERKLRFTGEPQLNSLYAWAINEIDDSGASVGSDQIPWIWSLSFTATEIVFSDSIDIKTEGPPDRVFRRREEVTQRRIIRAKLRPGDPRHDGDWIYQTEYQMFGSDRVVKDFRLDILPLTDPSEKEVCQAWGSVSYTSEHNFRDEMADDIVCFYLMLKPETFERYVRRIADGTADEIILRVGSVEGFYSQWSPEVLTRNVKVLTHGGEQQVEMPFGVIDELPRLGSVGEAELYINAVRTQAHKQVDDDGDPEGASLMRREIAASTTVIRNEAPQLTTELLRSIKVAVWVIAASAVAAIIRMIF